MSLTHNLYFLQITVGLEFIIKSYKNSFMYQVHILEMFKIPW